MPDGTALKSGRSSAGNCQKRMQRTGPVVDWFWFRSVIAGAVGVYENVVALRQFSCNGEILRLSKSVFIASISKSRIFPEWIPEVPGFRADVFCLREDCLGGIVVSGSGRGSFWPARMAMEVWVMRAS